MKIAFKLAVAGAMVAILAALSGPITTVAAQGAAAPAVAGDYKIGIVDMDEILRQYTKLQNETKSLEEKKNKIQQDLDAKQAALQAKMDQVKSAPESERERRSDEVRAEIRNLQADFQRLQGELNDEGAKLSVRTRQEIIKAIQEIGAAENYHLVLEADPDGRSTVIYFATPMNITSKVIAKLNGQSGAAAAAAPAPAASGGRKRDGQ